MISKKFILFFLFASFLNLSHTVLASAPQIIMPKDKKALKIFLGIPEKSTPIKVMESLHAFANILFFQEVICNLAEKMKNLISAERKASLALLQAFPNTKKCMRGGTIFLEYMYNFESPEAILILINHRKQVIGLDASNSTKELAVELMKSSNEECNQLGLFLKLQAKSLEAVNESTRLQSIIKYLFARMEHVRKPVKTCQAYQYISNISEIASGFFQLMPLAEQIPLNTEDVPTSYYQYRSAEDDFYLKTFPELSLRHEAQKSERHTLYAQTISLMKDLKMKLLGNGHKFDNLKHFSCLAANKNTVIMPDHSTKIVSDQEWQRIVPTLGVLPPTLDNKEELYKLAIDKKIIEMIDQDLQKPIDKERKKIAEKTASAHKTLTLEWQKQSAQGLHALTQMSANLLAFAEELGHITTEPPATVPGKIATHKALLLESQQQFESGLKTLTTILCASEKKLSPEATEKQASVPKKSADIQIRALVFEMANKAIDKHAKKILVKTQKTKTPQESFKNAPTPPPTSTSPSTQEASTVTHGTLTSLMPVIKQKQPKKANPALTSKEEPISPGTQAHLDFLFAEPKQSATTTLIRQDPDTALSSSTNVISKVQYKIINDYVEYEKTKPHIVSIFDHKHQIHLVLYLPTLPTQQKMPACTFTPTIDTWHSDPKKALFLKGDTNPEHPRYNKAYSFDLPYQHPQSLKRVCLIHNFSKLVDDYALRHGIIQQHMSTRLTQDCALVLPGHVEYQDESKESCLYVYFIDHGTCYHRNIDFRKRGTLGQEFLKNGQYALTEDPN